MVAKLKPLAKQVIVITGASSGNGLATAREAVAGGTSVVLAARNEPALMEIQRHIRAHGGQIEVVAADVSIEADVERIVKQAVDVFGGFDSWVNNAAVEMYGTVQQVTVEDHRRTVDVNYFGTLYGSLVAARHLKTRGGGAIINVGSILGDRSIILQGPHSATKHAVQGLTDTLRAELERERAGSPLPSSSPVDAARPILSMPAIIQARRRAFLSRSIIQG